jgi:hypothetical protein
MLEVMEPNTLNNIFNNKKGDFKQSPFFITIYLPTHKEHNAKKRKSTKGNKHDNRN